MFCSLLVPFYAIFVNVFGCRVNGAFQAPKVLHEPLLSAFIAGHWHAILIQHLWQRLCEGVGCSFCCRPSLIPLSFLCNADLCAASSHFAASSAISSRKFDISSLSLPLRILCDVVLKCSRQAFEHLMVRSSESTGKSSVSTRKG